MNTTSAPSALAHDAEVQATAYLRNPPSNPDLLSVLQGIDQARRAGLVMTNGKQYATGHGIAWDAMLLVDGKPAYRMWNDGSDSGSFCQRARVGAPAIATVCRRLAAIEVFNKQLLDFGNWQLECLENRQKQGATLTPTEQKALERWQSVATKGLAHDADDLQDLMDMYHLAMVVHSMVAREAKKGTVYCIKGKPGYHSYRAAYTPHARKQVLNLVRIRQPSAKVVFLNELLA